MKFPEITRTIKLQINELVGIYGFQGGFHGVHISEKFQAESNANKNRKRGLQCGRIPFVIHFLENR
jgi:hypothetical protein